MNLKLLKTHYLLGLSAAFFLVGALLLASLALSSPARVLTADVKGITTASPPPGLELMRVTRVIDGDTFEGLVEGKRQTVRYIGIDTPETVDPHRSPGCFGHEASVENKQLIEGKLVYLEKDISNTDKFDRWLRYVYLPTEDNNWLFVNDYLARLGFAKAKDFPPDSRYAQRFLEAQNYAKQTKLGLWEKC